MKESRTAHERTEECGAWKIGVYSIEIAGQQDIHIFEYFYWI